MLNPVVYLDPGHPSRKGDDGAVREGVKEVDLNWSLADMVEDLLCNTPIVVKRPYGKFVKSLKARGEAAREAKADLIVSLHTNASVNETFHGMRTFYNKTLTSQFVAENILCAAPQGLYVHGRKPTPATAKGWKRVAKVLSYHDRTPAVLVETGFLSNDGDRHLLEQDAIRWVIAGGIAQGVLSLLQYRAWQEPA